MKWNEKMQAVRRCRAAVKCGNVARLCEMRSKPCQQRNRDSNSKEREQGNVVALQWSAATLPACTVRCMPCKLANYRHLKYGLPELHFLPAFVRTVTFSLAENKRQYTLFAGSTTCTSNSPEPETNPETDLFFYGIHTFILHSDRTRCPWPALMNAVHTTYWEGPAALQVIDYLTKVVEIRQRFI